MLKTLLFLSVTLAAVLSCPSCGSYSTADNAYSCGGCNKLRKYPIILPHCGPDTPLPPPIDAPPIYAPAQEGPVIHLPAPPMPAPRIIAHKCVCTKTVVKPQVVRRLINVPSVRRYVKKSYRPVVENIAYSATPRCPQGPPRCSYSAPCQDQLLPPSPYIC